MGDGWLIWSGVGAGVWLAFATACWLMRHSPRGDVETAVGFALIRLHSRLVHRLRVEGLEHVPRAEHGYRVPNGPGSTGGLVVVANHTAGVDPLLVQSQCRFFIRWMMARDMILPELAFVWTWVEVIPVGRVGGPANEPSGDALSAREAMRHLESGGVLGLFPEGAIERPRGRLMPFLPGVGLLVKRTGASVLPVIIDGTPPAKTAWGSLLTFSRSRVRFLPVIEYGKRGMSAREIVADLEAIYMRETGWSMPERRVRRADRGEA
ncbi:MAG: 1-acyl-sn-glycerol-3-phosphate acyltransferase [Phycisphaeraceae bacterium]|nr:1-acyl-sn-glycerol-3-phosphate acyltransferase [Phycisphaeraceae bacterium]